MTSPHARETRRTAAVVLTVCLLALGGAPRRSDASSHAGLAVRPVEDVATRRASLSPSAPRAGRATTLLWSDDMEDGPNGWTHRDHGWGVEPHFHLTTFMAYEGDYSWWCGSPEYGVDGGYGNGWDDRLELPPVDVSGASYPVLTFAHRFHCESQRDVTVIQGIRGGVFDDMNAGFTGLIPGGDWLDIGAYGYVVQELDNPVEIRFRFTSDGAYSDEDGGFDSFGGAYMIDNIKIFDFYGGEVLFLDDCENGGLCNPNVRELSGDYWHIVDRPCAATSGSHVWWCGEDADTSHVPGGLDDWLISPPIDISGVAPGTACTLRYMLHAEVPTIDNDYWTVYASTDDGDWYQLGAWWGDFEACSGWSQAGADGLPVTDLLPGDSFRALFRFLTTPDGCGPGAAGGAGITLDDVELVAATTAVQATSWGSIKALYRK